MLEGVTYALPVLVWDVAVLEGKLDLVLILGRNLVEAIDDVSVTSGGLDQVLDLLGRNTTPALSVEQHNNEKITYQCRYCQLVCSLMVT